MRMVFAIFILNVTNELVGVRFMKVWQENNVTPLSLIRPELLGKFQLRYSYELMRSL